MAQKQFKPKPKASPLAKKPQNTIKRGNRAAPKQNSAVKLAKFQKKLRAKNINNLEQQMATKALSGGKMLLIKTGEKKE